MKKVWITGARGFIGRHLVLHLTRQGLSVSGIGHGQLPPNHWPAAGLVRWMNSEISAAALDQLAHDDGIPDCIFHLAGGSSVGASLQAPMEDFARTTVTTAQLLEWVRAHSPTTKLVVASSAAVYGDTHGVAAAESRVPSPVSPYGFHKLMMEQLCQEYTQVFGLRIAILRMFSVYGEGLRKQLLWDCSNKLVSGSGSITLGGDGSELRDWIHVEDVAAAMHRAVDLSGPDCPIFNCGSGLGTSVKDVVSQLAADLSPARIEFSGISRPGDPRTLVADPARMKAAGLACGVSLASGIRRYAEWFKRHSDPE